MLGDDLFQARAELGTALFALGSLSRELNAPEETARTLHELGASLREPFLFVVLGEVKAGKSSLLNALFGRDFCRVDVLPATDKIYVFKHAETSRDVPINAQLTECYRDAAILKDFNIVDTPGTNTIVAEHETITRQFLPLADLCLCVFSATNPWGATAWQFLQHIHRKWLKKVVFILQQRDLRAPEEVQTIVQHMEQTMLQKIGERCPIFPLSAKLATAAKQNPDPAESTRLLEESGFAALEQHIAAHVTGGETLREKLRSVTRSAQVVLLDLASKVRASATTLDRDNGRLIGLRASLTERKEQSLRHIQGVVWTLSQNYQRIQARAEELLREKLTLGGTLKLMFGKAEWQKNFQAELEARQRETLNQHLEDALQLIQADLKSVWKQVHDMMEHHFAEHHDSGALPDLDRQRKQLLDKIALTLIEKGDGTAFDAQMQRLFADTALWLRVPASVLAAGGIATVIAAALTKLTVLDITGTIAGVGALGGTIVALVRRQKIISEFQRELTGRREASLQAIEDHLRHAMTVFYLELEQLFLPLEAFCAGQKKALEPQLERIRELEETLSRRAATLGAS